MGLKKRLRRTALAACICLLAAGTGMAASASEKGGEKGGASFQRFRTGDTADRIPPGKLKKITAAEAQTINASMKAYSPKGDSLVRNAADTYYYYDQLDSVAKEIYDVMLEIAKDPSTDENYGLMMTDLDPESDEYYYKVLCAYFAMTYDHPELFWLYCSTETSISYYSEGMDIGGLYLVYYGFTKPYEQYVSQMTAFNNAAQQFLSGINTNASQYEIARQIHDKLIDTVTYDRIVSDNMDTQGQNLAHTAYGALVANSEGVPNHAVCDGYALAYEYLLQQCGIEAVVLGGDAGPDEWSLGGHAWNAVRLDGTWYETDSTWDDTITDEEDLTPDVDGYAYFYEALHDQTYRDKLSHFLFMISTDHMTSYEPDMDYYRYITYDQSVELCMVGSAVHKRSVNDGTVSPLNADPTVLSLGPTAPYDYPKY